MPLDTLHHSPVQTPVPMDDETMLDPPVPTTTPTATCTKPSTSSQESEEDLLHAHLAIAETNRSIIRSNGINSLMVIPQFTPIPMGGFPHIHLAHVAQFFDYQAAKVINTWLKVPHPKILVRVFDHDGKNPSVKGPILVERLCIAVSEIMHFIHQDGQEVKVSPPCPEATTEDANYPLSFLIYNISEEMKSLILNQSAVYEVWMEDVTRWDICDILSKGDIPEDKVHTASWDFIKSLWIECLDFKVSSSILLPCYNVFAISPTNTPTVWTKLHWHCGQLHALPPLPFNHAPARALPIPQHPTLEQTQAQCGNETQQLKSKRKRQREERPHLRSLSHHPLDTAHTF
ncbi:uncharacterized protein BJ212DRAFT_1303429 [Suillus subaureus]|uniref:Uncharacterized protein n=1 Tax=Suillus subaureus TaxID=48587 RepID=A0A9P7DZZ2_9AGAM|nr:uncharacterized protein BJ212DRAFT_1303429 [Suillus subaureus]KAG1807459.1 hypothetical protein BJ212DRAFT_1303429 [Suillus subaureus]